MLIFFLDQSAPKEFELDGTRLPGTDRLNSILNISASTILERGTLLRIDAGIGLTDDSPDYRLGFTLPLRLANF